ncbi:hypothetical protein ACFQJD_19060 [Haloplanus sp. GCM10025708]|uniref:DUF7266 family protein n=1 Tax=Haloferacaceae TaxID=1644056 RepID=UPI00361836FD
MPDRAVAPVVGKLLEAGIVVLFIVLLTTVLYGGVVPSYRAAVGAELGDRTLVSAADRVESAVPETGDAVSVELRVDLPETLRGAGYSIRARGRALVLDHPHPRIGGETALGLPSRVVRVEGEWESARPATVAVRGSGDGLRVTLR